MNLTGWALTRGVILLPNTTLAAGGYVVVAAHLPSFVSKYPAVANVVGGWTGRLANSYEAVKWKNTQGEQVDLVRSTG